VLGLAIAPDGRRGFAACADGVLYAVDLATGSADTFEENHQSFAIGCVLLPDGRTIISSGYDGLLLWHDVETRRCWRRGAGAPLFWNWQLALAPDGSRLATTTGQYLPGGWKYEPAAESEPSVKVYEQPERRTLIADFSHTPPVLSCAFSPDGQHLAAANMMGEGARVESPGGAPMTSRSRQWTSPDFTSWGTTKTHHLLRAASTASPFPPMATALLG